MSPQRTVWLIRAALIVIVLASCAAIVRARLSTSTGTAGEGEALVLVLRAGASYGDAVMYRRTGDGLQRTTLDALQQQLETAGDRQPVLQIRAEGGVRQGEVERIREAMANRLEGAMPEIQIVVPQSTTDDNQPIAE